MELRTVGDHVRRRRLDLGLTQRQIAARLGVNKTTVFSWEAGTTSPHLRALPAVIRFLGYDPRQEPDPSDLPSRIRYMRRNRGLSQLDLANRIRVDPATIQHWETRRNEPTPELRERVMRSLGLRPPIAPPDASFGERIRVFRLGVGWTQRDLGRRVGVHKSVVSHWELGQRLPSKSPRARLERIMKHRH